MSICTAIFVLLIGLLLGMWVKEPLITLMNDTQLQRRFLYMAEDIKRLFKDRSLPLGRFKSVDAILPDRSQITGFVVYALSNLKTIFASQDFEDYSGVGDALDQVIHLYETNSVDQSAYEVASRYAFEVADRHCHLDSSDSYAPCRAARAAGCAAQRDIYDMIDCCLRAVYHKKGAEACRLYELSLSDKLWALMHVTSSHHQKEIGESQAQ